LTCCKYRSIEQFAIRANASNICLLFEAGDVHYPVGVADPLTGMLGYHTPADPDPALCPAMSLDAAVDAQPGIAFEPPRGLRSFPAIFSYPIVRVYMHLCGIVHLGFSYVSEAGPTRASW
jgi:hypothetical protein